MLRNPRHSFRALVVAILLASQASGQNPPVRQTASSFDVATIRQSPDRSGQPGWMGVQVTGGTFEARSMSLKSLVWFAYANGGPQKQMVAGGGGWIDSQQWDVMAKVDDPSLAELSNQDRTTRLRPLVQALLEERFHLKIHTEMRPTPVYVLTQVKSGAKVKEAPAPPAMTGDFTEAMKRYREENPGKPFPGMISCSGDRCTATAVMMSAAMGQIQGSSRSDRPVVDQTGLKGYYDFSFRMPRRDDDDAMGEIEEDLGMKFEPRKIDLQTYVIDSAEKPSEN